MMFTKYEESVFEYLEYSAVDGFSFHANIKECPPNMYVELREIDTEMAGDTGHAIDNWREIPS